MPCFKIDERAVKSNNYYGCFVVRFKFIIKIYELKDSKNLINCLEILFYENERNQRNFQRRRKEIPRIEYPKRNYFFGNFC